MENKEPKKRLVKMEEKLPGKPGRTQPWVPMKEVLRTDLCKTCDKNPRRQASAYCQPCSDKYHGK